MNHIKEIFQKDSNKLLWLQYYAAMFSKRFDALAPFSLLISSTLLFGFLSKKKELIPLLNAGLSLQRQMVPFICVAIFAMLCMWINTQFIFPKAIQTYDMITDTDYGKEKVPDDVQPMGLIYLNDGGKVFFQKADKRKRQLYDVFWVTNHSKIAHIEVLSYQEAIPQGTLIDVIEKTSDGIARKIHSIPSGELSTLYLTDDDVRIATRPTKHLSISELLTMASRMNHSSSEKASDIFITLMLKLLTPLTCLLTLFVPMIFCLKFEGGKHPALLLFIFLASLFMFQLSIQACTILARIPGFPTFLFLILPWTVAGYYCAKKTRTFLETA